MPVVWLSQDGWLDLLPLVGVAISDELVVDLEDCWWLRDDSLHPMCWL